MMRTAIIICALYAVAAVLLLISSAVERRRPHSSARWHASRAYRAMEYVGKSSSYFAMGLTVALMLSIVLRSLGLLPEARR